MKKNTLLHFLLLLLLTYALPALAADSNKNSKSSGADSKKQVYMGDPATKRGYELGYDDGVKAGKDDKKKGRKESASSHEDYKNGEKKFRSEYGNRGKFAGGYQGGFLKGYKSGYNREKTDLEAAKLAKISDKEKLSEKTNNSESKPKKLSTETSVKEPNKATDTIAKPTKAKPRAPTAADDAL